ncbi:hypothetical protein BDB00DRAFT_863400 [Zychaea mexicana]|uniref:uncharacterized protein n=1 Tax=Zychaea mexicana TaxID=64656 RepID=UPI0022FE1042|nr:uncharacterized protein BDB00DRAFT_863400 [Zychaea mexicana]KAI9468852.1 hypothetical protein BDB00DRAFT_863400 [Zychaea mexicana]
MGVRLYYTLLAKIIAAFTKTMTISRSTDSNCTQQPPIERAFSSEHDDCCCMSLR